MIDTWHECDRLYYLDLDPKSVACSISISAFDEHYLLGHSSLQT